MTRLAGAMLEHAFGVERGRAILGDLHEDLAGGRTPRLASWAPGVWLLCQAIAHVVAARWSGHGSDASTRSDSPRTSEIMGMWYDARQAVRSLRSSPTFTIVTLTVLSLAIGSTTAIFSVVDAVALRRLPYDQSDRLVQVGTIDLRTGSFDADQPPQNFGDWRVLQDVFVAIAAMQPASGFTLDEGGIRRDLPALMVTADYFAVYRSYPQLGRAFTEHDEQSGARVALISDGAWRRHFGSDPNVIGRTLRSTPELTYGAPFPVPAGTWTIVGVMPTGFRSSVSGLSPADVWVPYVVPEDQRTREGGQSAPLQITARLIDGVTVETAGSRVEAITASLAESHPAWFEQSRGAVRTLHEATVGSARAWMLMLLGAVSVVLLIGCVNVASLMLARATTRGREVRTRTALGASRWHIARLLLVESLVLTAGAMILGLLAAVWGIEALRTALPESLPRVSMVALNERVLSVAIAASMITGLLFGLAPALLLSRSGTVNGFGVGSRGGTVGGTRLRAALVVTEIALAVVLLIGAGLFLSSFARVTSVEIGLDPRNVLTVDFWPRYDPSTPGMAESVMARSAAAVPEILARVAAVPGVEAAGFIVGDLPLSGYSARAEVVVPGRERFEGGDRVQVRRVTPGYAGAIGSPLLRGRHIEAGDTQGAPLVVVLNQEAVKRYFGEREPLGATLTIERGHTPLATVVGVVGDVRLFGPESAVRPEAYLSAAQGRFVGGSFAVRVDRDPLAYAGVVREAIRASFPELPEPEAGTMEALLGGLIAQRRFNMLIVGLFGSLALAIAAVGLYGMVTYVVGRRTREYGVRLALGASPARLLTSVVASGVAHTATGVAVGLAVAWPLGSAVEALLFEVRPHDPLVYATAALVLGVVGVAAAFFPARRAARVNPVTALSAE